MTVGGIRSEQILRMQFTFVASPVYSLKHTKGKQCSVSFNLCTCFPWRHIKGKVQSYKWTVVEDIKHAIKCKSREGVSEKERLFKNNPH